MDIPESAHPLVRWIGSLLQAIVQNGIKDCRTGKSIATRIYPQEDGAPVASTTGEYLVKLNYAGKCFRVAVDDRLPIDLFQ